ncbi:MAG: stage II sporulation protein M [Nanoarchaeota archaeon]
MSIEPATRLLFALAILILAALKIYTDTKFSAKKSEKRPYSTIFIGMIYSALGLSLAFVVDRENSSMIMVFFTVVAAMPFIYNVIRLEEKKDESIYDERILLKEHSRAIETFIFLFIGMVIVFSLSKAFLPTAIGDELFLAQDNVIQNIISGQATVSLQSLLGILSNNLSVLFFCIVFSLIYGLGAIYILTWNASVLGAAIGSFISTNLASLSHLTGIEKGAEYFKVFSCGYFLRYLPHGIFEMLGFFVAGLAGAIISVAIVRKTFGTKKFANVIYDSSDLILIAIALIVLAAIIEVFFTPGLFRLLCS